MTSSNAFSSNRVARGVAIETLYRQVKSGSPAGRPIKILIMGIADATKTTIDHELYEYVSLSDTADKFGYGSTLYQAAKSLFPPNAVGVDSSTEVYLFPCEVSGGGAAAGSVAFVGTPTATKAETYRLKINNVYANDITTSVGDEIADWIDKAVVACAGVVDFPLTATDGATTLDLDAVHHGAAGDHYFIEIESPDDAEFTFSITQPTGGSGTVDTDAALTAFGDDWFSHVINAVDDVSNYTLLDDFDSFGEARREPEIRKPVKFYTGSNEATLATVTAITDARKLDRTNTIKHSPGSNDLPWVIAGRMVAIQANIASRDPSRAYCLQPVSLLNVGPKANQLTSAQRDATVKKGLSTIEIVGGKVAISDAVMCYHPDGEDPPGWRYDATIEKECAMLFSLDLIFTNPADAGMPLLPDAQFTKNPNARKPSYWKQLIFNLYEGAAEAGIIEDADYAKENTSVVITSANRIDVVCVYRIAGNYRIAAVSNIWSIYTGGE